jgi:hypothetical protein
VRLGIDLNFNGRGVRATQHNSFARHVGDAPVCEEAKQPSKDGPAGTNQNYAELRAAKPRLVLNQRNAAYHLGGSGACGVESQDVVKRHAQHHCIDRVEGDSF